MDSSLIKQYPFSKDRIDYTISFLNAFIQAHLFSCVPQVQKVLAF